ncbi:energy-coupling factor ABC transporter ATP-binding protein [Methanogenium marinum]|uniref:Energy-coupling factor ABC transporter ATP-binding protein n=1 Tax=Methanogenium marinum TaxID=348610 RepID=A0A9Q4PYA5_9EURY|nr:energy-coupling factor ABC transporter ATP-binding protein [Methanogenium marinum]MDE4907512.1 energy-coupling factor ABC transporter ATP-binding protein [Methanogenium marinum]
MIYAQNLRHRLLDIESLHIGGGHTTIIGHNGSGKTTFLKLCAGIELPQHGTLTISGKEPRAVDIGWVGEVPDNNLVFRTVYDEVASGLRFRRTPVDDIEPAVLDVLSDMGILHLSSRASHTLSGGEKALVACAAALALSPELLILDETDTHLDRKAADILETMIHRRPAPCILQCTHDMDTAACSDQVIYFDGGHPRYAGTPDEVFFHLSETEMYPPLWRIAECI